MRLTRRMVSESGALTQGWQGFIEQPAGGGASGCLYVRDHGRECSQGRGRVLAGSCELLRDVIAGNYLAITRHVHALSEQPAGFYYALQAIGNGLVRFIQGFDDLS